MLFSVLMLTYLRYKLTTTFLCYIFCGCKGNVFFIIYKLFFGCWFSVDGSWLLVILNKDLNINPFHEEFLLQIFAIFVNITILIFYKPTNNQQQSTNNQLWITHIMFGHDF